MKNIIISFLLIALLKAKSFILLSGIENIIAFALMVFIVFLTESIIEDLLERINEKKNNDCQHTVACLREYKRAN